MTTLFHIEGTHCSSCKFLIEDVCQEILGVQSAVVDLEKKTLAIEHAEDVDLSLLEKNVANLGEYRLTRV